MNSNNNSIGAIDSTDLATGAMAGTAKITATLDGITNPAVSLTGEAVVSPESKVTMVKGRSVWYREEGMRIPILILAGWGGPTDSYFTIQDILAKQGYNVFLPDLPGLPGKTLSTLIPLDGWGSWIQEFWDAVIGEKFFIVAHSLSGQIALQYASKEGTQCLGVIFLNPWFLSTFCQEIFYRLVAKGIRFLCPLVYPEMKWVRNGKTWTTAVDLLCTMHEKPKAPCIIFLGKKDPATYLFGGWKKVHCKTKQYNWDHSPQITTPDQLATAIDEFIRITNK